MSNSLETAEGARFFTDSLLGPLRELFAQTGAMPISAFVFTRFNPSTQKTHECEAAACSSIFQDGTTLSHDQFAKALHGFVEATHAVGLVLIAEGWVALSDKGAVDPKSPMDVKGRPGAKEGLLVTLEHRALGGMYGLFAEITRPTEDTALLGEFSTVFPFCLAGERAGAFAKSGALTNFLKPQM